MDALNSAKEYIHKSSIGNRERCIASAIKVQEWLRQQYANSKIQGWETNYIDRLETLEERLIFIDIDKIVNIKYPFLHLAVQVEENNFFEINIAIIKFGFFKVE